jgi:hypothetical protein
MKKLILIIIKLIAINGIMNGQATMNRDSPTVSILYGYCKNTVFNMGLAVKNLKPGGKWGCYFVAEGLNTAQTEGASGDILFNSSFGWRDTETYKYEDIPNFGMSIGATYNASSFLNRENLGLTIFSGIGFSKSIRQEEMRIARYYNNSYLSPSFRYYITNVEERTMPTIEALVEFDIIPKGMLSMTIMAGANSSIGLLLFGSVGLRIHNSQK